MINLSLRRAVQSACAAGLVCSSSAWAGLTTFDSEAYFEATISETYYAAEAEAGYTTQGVLIEEEDAYTDTDGNTSASVTTADVPYNGYDDDKETYSSDSISLSASASVSGSTNDGEDYAEGVATYDAVWQFGCDGYSLGASCIGDFELDLEWGASISAMITEYGDEASALASVNVDLYLYEDYDAWWNYESQVVTTVADLVATLPEGVLAYSETLQAQVWLEFMANERDSFVYTYHLELADMLQGVIGSAGDYWYDSFDAGLLIVSLEASGWAEAGGSTDPASLGGGLDPIGDDPEPWGDDDDHADVPEPGTLGLLGIGLLGLGFARARRQRA